MILQTDHGISDWDLLVSKVAHKIMLADRGVVNLTDAWKDGGVLLLYKKVERKYREKRMGAERGISPVVCLTTWGSGSRLQSTCSQPGCLYPSQAAN